MPTTIIGAYDVYLGRKLIDTVFYSDYSQDREYVKRSLVEHDGYDPNIRIVIPPRLRKRRKTI